MKKKNLILVAVVATLGLAVVATPVYAESDCVVSGGAMTIAGNAPCVMTEAVTTINYTGTLEDFNAVVHAYKNNAGFNYATWANPVTINATFANDISTDGIDAVVANTPADTTVNVVPGSGVIVYTSLPYALPASYSIDYSRIPSVTVQAPDTTSVVDALGLFLGINNGAPTVAAGANYNITSEGSSSVPTVHLNNASSWQDVVDAMNAVRDEAESVVVAYGNNGHIYLDGDEATIYFEAGTTPDAVKEALDGVAHLAAKVKIIGNSSYSADLSSDGVLTVAEIEDGLIAPAAGVFVRESMNSMLIVLATSASIAFVASVAALVRGSKK